jgi:hypothetical protein
LVARITLLNDVAGIIVLGIVCVLFRTTDAISNWKLPAPAWAFFTLGLGGVLGGFTHILIRGARSATEGMAMLLGSIALASGMAGYLGISPLVSCATAGAVFANLPYERMQELRETMRDLERPLYFIFLLIAGAEWAPWAWQGWALTLVFVIARVGGKLIGAHVSKRVGPAALPDAGTLGLALCPHSPISMATMLSFYVLYRPEASTAGALPWLFTTCIGAAIATEFVVQIEARRRGGLAFDVNSTSIRPGARGVLDSMSGDSMAPPPLVPQRPPDGGGGHGGAT